MSRDSLSNLAHSVRQRLLNLSKEREEDPNLIFIRYALERLLYRLSRSDKAEQFVLKGAMLFAVWTDRMHRPTRDLDLLGLGNPSDRVLVETFRQIAQTEVEPDGLEFDSENISITDIREAQDYPGKRVKIVAKLGNAPIRLQVDIGFGDVVTPEAEEINYPTLLDFPLPRVKTYPRETVVAEKLQAFVAFDMAISRMKDFYDLWVLSKQFSFDGEILVKAITATFDRRKTAMPSDTPPALTDEFASSNDKVTQWNAFLKRNELEEKVDLPKVVQDLRQFLLPPLLPAAGNDIIGNAWPPGGPWS
jgi:predicted nucleotidyltransferase component of viral defense system